MKNLNAKQKTALTKRQIKELVKRFETKALANVERAINSGAVAEDILSADDYLLTKMILDSAMRERPFMPPPHYQKDFDNLHVQL